MIQTIDGASFQRMIIHAAAAINAQKEKVNDLNVFPVPDGDTGTNMSLTIGAAAAELKKQVPATVGQADSFPNWRDRQTPRTWGDWLDSAWIVAQVSSLEPSLTKISS